MNSNKTDPRLQGRSRRYGEADKKKKKQTRRRFARYFALIFFSAAIIFVILCLTVFFDIREIEVKGATKYSAQEIADASGIIVGDNMLRENISTCSSNITSKLIYVETAEVKKRFPYTIEITVEACVPTVNVQCMSGYFLLSRSGRILEELSNPRTGLLTINGAEADISLVPGQDFASLDENKTADIYKLIDAFEDHGIEKVTYIDITDRADVWFLYDGRIKVELGVVSDLDYKLKFADEIIQKNIGSGTRGTLRSLNDSWQFIDEAGLAENDRIFEQNILTSVTDTESLLPEKDEDDGEEGSESVTEAPAESDDEVTEARTAATTME